jgi:hypothetical protein
MQRPNTAESFHGKAPEVGGAVDPSTVAVAQHKSAQDEEEIHEQVRVADEDHAVQRTRYYPNEVEDDDQYGAYPSPCIEGFESIAICHSEFSPPN